MHLMICSLVWKRDLGETRVSICTDHSHRLLTSWKVLPLLLKETNKNKQKKNPDVFTTHCLLCSGVPAEELLSNAVRNT